MHNTVQTYEAGNLTMRAIQYDGWNHSDILSFVGPNTLAETKEGKTSIRTSKGNYVTLTQGDFIVEDVLATTQYPVFFVAEPAFFLSFFVVAPSHHPFFDSKTRVLLFAFLLGCLIGLAAGIMFYLWYTKL